jgi:hypothetical protein
MSTVARTSASSLPSASASATGSAIDRWLQLTSYGWARTPQTFAHRELARRSRLASAIILVLLLADVLVLPLGVDDPTTLVAILVAAVGLVLAAGLNRLGHTSLAGGLIIGLITTCVFSSIVLWPAGLTLDALPGFDLLAFTVIVAASVLPRRTAFWVAALNMLLICGDFLLQPHSADLRAWLARFGDPAVASVQLMVRPVALQLVFAVVAYLWVRGAEEAIRRADLAEELAALEHEVAEQRRHLEQSTQHIHHTLVRAANGEYVPCPPLGRDNALWHISSSLNVLLARLQKSAPAELRLTRTEDELRRIALALEDLRRGRLAYWPSASNTPADIVLDQLTQMWPRPGSRMGATPPMPEPRDASGTQPRLRPDVPPPLRPPSFGTLPH